MMARCVRKYGKEKTHAVPVSATLRMLVCTWCAVGLLMRACCHRLLESCPAHLCMSSSVLLSSSGPLRSCARNAECESLPVTAVTCRGASARMLHCSTLTVGLPLMLRSQNAPRDVPIYTPQLFIPLPHPPACPSQRPVGLCVESHERLGPAVPFDMLHSVARENEHSCSSCVPTSVAPHVTLHATHTGNRGVDGAGGNGRRNERCEWCACLLTPSSPCYPSPPLLPPSMCALNARETVRHAQGAGLP